MNATPFRLFFAALAALALAGPAAAQPSNNNAAQSPNNNAAPPPTSATTAQQPASDAAAQGKVIFMRDGCYECHGTVGQGGGRAGPRLAPNPLPIDAVTMQLRHPAAMMPVYTTAVLTDAQIADIVAYLRSIPSSPAAQNIPLLQQ